MIKKVKFIKLIATPPTSNKKYIAEFELLKEDGKKKIKRHEKDLQTKDFTRPGYLSYYLLWDKPTIGASITSYKNRFRA